MMKAFITGSHVYGRPNAKSDLDLVVLVDQFASGKLREFSDSDKTIRFGDLNIILCFTENEFNAWKTTTDRLVKIHRETGAIFDKISAHPEFEKDQKAFGVQYHGDSGQDYSPEETVVVPVKNSPNPFDNLMQ